MHMNVNFVPVDRPVISHFVERFQQDMGFWDGICHVDPEPPAEGDDPPSTVDPNEFNTVLETMRKERDRANTLDKDMRALKRQLEAFSGIDPEAAKRAIAEAEQAEEMERRLTADIEKRFAPQIDKMTAQNQQLTQQNQMLQQQYDNFRRDTALESEFYAAGGLPGEFVAIAQALQTRVAFGDDGKTLLVVDENGKPDMVVEGAQSKPKTVRHLIDELKNDPGYLWFARHFKGSEKPGFGTNSNSVTGDPAFANMSPWDRVASLREKQGRA